MVVVDPRCFITWHHQLSLAVYMLNVHDDRFDAYVFSMVGHGKGRHIHVWISVRSCSLSSPPALPRLQKQADTCYINTILTVSLIHLGIHDYVLDNTRPTTNFIVSFRICIIVSLQACSQILSNTKPLNLPFCLFWTSIPRKAYCASLYWLVISRSYESDFFRIFSFLFVNLMVHFHDSGHISLR